MNQPAIIAAALTGVVGLLGVIAGAYLTQRAQHAHWLRERKITAISSYVEDMSRVVDTFHAGLASTAAERVELLHGMQSGRTAIHLLCENPTRDAAEEMARTARRLEADQSAERLDAAGEALKEFVRLARMEVGPMTQRWQRPLHRDRGA